MRLTYASRVALAWYRARYVARRLLALVLVALALSLAGCVNGKLSPLVAPIVNGIDQAVCKIVQVADPSSAVYVGSVCDVAAPIVSGILSGLSDRRVIAKEQPCKLTPITDGKQGLGVVCASICGDMTKASAADPCPAVDAKLRGAP